jgi:hypothetical protein
LAGSAGGKPFWETTKQDPAEQKKNRERMRQERALREEKSALLVDLLGVDPEKERRKADGRGVAGLVATAGGLPAAGQAGSGEQIPG